LHRLAGSRNIIELHGNILQTKCFEENVPVNSWPETAEIPPRCPHCGGLLRPDVVWFGESLPAESLHAALKAARESEIFFSVGTASLVQPAASLPLIALEQGKIVVEINPQSTSLTSRATYALAGRAGQVLPELVSIVWSEPGNSPGEG
jgi:NAD-dependent deacetylase